MKRAFKVTQGSKTAISPGLPDVQAEIMVIMIMFHSYSHKCLKHFYLNEICVWYGHLFPQTVSYNRFTELEKSVAAQFVIFVKKCLLGKCTGISFVDSTLLRVCRNQRIHIPDIVHSRILL